jgi:hypothetical protein
MFVENMVTIAEDVRRVREQEPYALVAELREALQVDGRLVERRAVDLEVGRVDDHADGRVEGHGERVGDRVVYVDEFGVERTDRNTVSRLHLDDLDLVLAELRLAERVAKQAGGIARRVDGDVERLEQQRQRADVVLVAVRDQHARDVGCALEDRREVGREVVDAERVVVREGHAAVIDENLAVELEEGAVHAHLPETAEGGVAQCQVVVLDALGSSTA